MPTQTTDPVAADLVVSVITLGATPDAQLAAALSRRSETALAEIFQRHSGTLLGVARRVLGDHARAEEVVQEVFLRLWRAPQGFDPDRGCLRSYLITIAHRRAIDLLRSDVARARRENRSVLERPTAGDDVIGASELVGRLPIDQRNAIELTYFEGLTHREAALALDVPEGTIKSRIRSGLHRLRLILSARIAAHLPAPVPVSHDG